METSGVVCMDETASILPVFVVEPIFSIRPENKLYKLVCTHEKLWEGQFSDMFHDNDNEYEESMECEDNEYIFYEDSKKWELKKCQDSDHEYKVFFNNAVMGFSSYSRFELIHYTSRIFSNTFCRFKVNLTGLTHYCSQSGVTLIIPEGAVQQLTNVWFGVCQLSDRFEFGNYVPVTPIVWLYTDKELIKPAKLSQPHNIDINTIEEGQLIHLVASDKTFMEDHYFQFIPSNDEFKVKEKIFETSCHHFCSNCIAANKDNYRKIMKWYTIAMAQKEENDTTVKFHFCIFPAQVHCLELVKRQFKEQNFKIEGTTNIKFDAEKYVTTKFDPNELNNGWHRHVQSKKEEKITEKEVNYFMLLGENFGKEEIEQLQYWEKIYTYPPRFRYIYCCTNEIQGILKQRVFFNGVDTLGDDLLIFWQPKGRATPTDKLDAVERFRRKLPELSNATSTCVTRLSGKLNAKGLITADLHQYIIDSQDMESKKAEKLILELEKNLRNKTDPEEYLSKLLTVLRDLREPQINEIIDTI